MDFVIYVVYKAFNSGKKKGLFLYNFRLLFTFYFFTITIAILYILQQIFEIKLKLSFDNLSKDQRLIMFLVILVTFAILFSIVKRFVIYEERVKKSIKKYSHVYLPNYAWVILFFVIHFMVAATIPLVASCF